METNNPHLDKGCPGRDFFDRKDERDKEDIKKIFQEVVGDVPKYMKMAGENRIWLWVLSLGFILTGIILLII